MDLDNKTSGLSSGFVLVEGRGRESGREGGNHNRKRRNGEKKQEVVNVAKRQVQQREMRTRGKRWKRKGKMKRRRKKNLKREK